MPSDLVIVYHRQPYEEVEVDGKIQYRENKSPNGIVPTLKSLFGKVPTGAWIAWKQAEDPANPGFEQVIEIDDAYGKYRVSRLPLTKEQVSSFYHITSKEAFWPILHNFKERYNYDPVDWPTFQEVNRKFAEAAAAEANPNAIVWVHDYNLWLVAGYLRKLRPDVRIAFFHHTPFPSADMFNVLPWRKEIMQSLLSCDVVGFHIPRYAENFVGAAQSLLDVEVTGRRDVPESLMTDGGALSDRRVPHSLRYRDRDITVATSPVGVNVNYIEDLAATQETEDKVAAIREELGDCRLILSVGRTDYTKGGVEQLQAYERLLKRRPDLRGKVRLMHVSVMANANMTAYQEVQSGLESLAGHINGLYGSFEWQPLAFISNPVPFKDLIAYYKVADVAWITPLADGMNLVCEEYASARTDGDGCLVLSEFAGAAVVMSDAVLTNPFSHRSMDAAIERALAMDEETRRHRMASLRAATHRHSVEAWAAEQMRSFDGFGAALEMAGAS
ncbi:glucosylglycerol-phosphate synthase [Mangrovicoccus sp. HB161399]|uniref:glucosylglycerol-phosphate synthase n=1 Tax=Mangrovicoccus sp. HB161399 TaxID=2720392 RepID=UPI0015558138|nr:glucosylglycerol-phosphate synthase [Mangrovicoccus sp. HB161399]